MGNTETYTYDNGLVSSITSSAGSRPDATGGVEGNSGSDIVKTITYDPSNYYQIDAVSVNSTLIADYGYTAGYLSDVSKLSQGGMVSYSYYDGNSDGLVDMVINPDISYTDIYI
ncbi:hypothetical protein [Pseudodesulfovibrio indicus]|uniref:hypothetical protein n=1 Tax=Pseudodesulfovibrio indicus TaxID=1716143 RepID=UPI0029315C0B|nr:hypothetical protein [Pseudodesulfovibrio indicus]